MSDKYTVLEVLDDLAGRKLTGGVMVFEHIELMLSHHTSKAADLLIFAHALVESPTTVQDLDQLLDEAKFLLRLFYGQLPPGSAHREEPSANY